MHSRIAARQAAVLLMGLLLAPASAGAQQAIDRFKIEPLEQPQHITQSTSTEQPKSQEAIDHSDAYYKRLTIHRYLSYAELPLFGAEYYLGNKLYKGNGEEGSVKGLHGAVAAGLGGLFAINTVTGVWNLYEARKDPNKFKRYLHSALMLAADAGFAYTGLITTEDAEDRFEFENGNLTRSGSGASKHRNAALVSMGTATLGTLVMWLVPDKE